MWFFSKPPYLEIEDRTILQRNLSLGKLNTCHHTCIDPAWLSILSSQGPQVPSLCSQLFPSLTPQAAMPAWQGLVPPVFLAEVRSLGFPPLGTRITCWTGSSIPPELVLNKQEEIKGWLIYLWDKQIQIQVMTVDLGNSISGLVFPK